MLDFLVIELQVEAEWQNGDVGIFGRCEAVVGTIPDIIQIILGRLGRYAVVGGIEVGNVLDGLIVTDVIIVGRLDVDGFAVVGQHVFAAFTLEHPYLVGLVGDVCRSAAEGQRLGVIQFGHLIITLSYLAVFERAATGQLIELERKYPLFQARRGLALIDNAVHLDIG